MSVPTASIKYDRYNVFAYPMNLVSKVIREKYPVELLPKDLVGSLEYAISTLPKRQSEILFMRYRDKLEMSEIAERTGKTAYELEAIIKEGVRNLQNPALSRFVYHGVGKLISLKTDDLRKLAYAEVLYVADEEVEDILYQRKKEEREDAKPDRGEKMVLFKSFSVSQLDISPSCEHTLQKQGLTTIPEVIEAVIKKWEKTALNPETRTYDEYTSQAILAKYGILLPDTKNGQVKLGREAVYSLKIEALESVGVSKAVLQRLKALGDRDGYYGITQMKTVSDVVVLYQKTKFHNVDGLGAEARKEVVAAMSKLKINLNQIGVPA